MKCKRCNTLLAAYERSVHVFVNAVLTFREAEGDDSTMSVEEDHRLHLKCKGARDALMAHLRKRHGDFDKNAEAST